MQVGTHARDVTAQSHETLERILTLSSEGILLADAEESGHAVIFANGAYEELTGYTAAELAGRRWPLAARAASGEPELHKLKAALARNEPCELTVQEVRKDGTRLRSRLSVEPLFDARGKLKYFLCVQRPAAGRAKTAKAAKAVRMEAAGSGGKAMQEQLVLAPDVGRGRPRPTSPDRVDATTGLLRFEYFKDLFGRDLAAARREQRPMALLLFEVVEFEVYRQTFGAKAADSCQRMIAAQVTRTLRRSSDLCARCDDATIVASVVDQQPGEVQPLAERIAENVRRLGLHNPRAKTARSVLVRTAVVSCGASTEGVDALIARARSLLPDPPSAPGP